MLLVVDIDGTISDLKWRADAAPPRPHREDPKFEQWCDDLQGVDGSKLLKDNPIPHTKEVLTLLQKQYTIVYVTAREEKHRIVTSRWIVQNGYPPGKLYMRAESYRGMDNAEYKEMQTKRAAAEFQTNNVLVLDDDPTGHCAPAYKRNGWTHFKVTYSEY